MLAARNLRNYAAETRMEVNLGGHDVGKERPLPVDDGSRRFVARGLNGQNERTVRAQHGFHTRCRRRSRSAHRSRFGGHHALVLRNRLLLKRHARHITGCKRQRARHDDRVFAVGVIARTHAQGFETERFVERLRTRIRRTHFQRCLVCSQIARVSRSARQQPARNTAASARRLNGNLQYLHLPVDHPRAHVARKHQAVRADRSVRPFRRLAGRSLCRTRDGERAAFRPQGQRGRSRRRRLTGFRGRSVLRT